MGRLTNSGGWLVRSRNERNINFIKPTIILVRARGSSISGFDYGIEEEIIEFLKITDDLLDKLDGEDYETLKWLIFGYNECAKMLNLKEEIIKEAREYVEGSMEELLEILDGNK